MTLTPHRGIAVAASQAMAQELDYHPILPHPRGSRKKGLLLRLDVKWGL